MKDIMEYLNHLLDTSTPYQPAWNKEAIRENFEAAWNYIDGCMILAVLKIYHATGDKKYVSFADEFVDAYVHEDGSILGYSVEEYNCDNINGGKVLFQLYELTGKEKYKKALDLIYSQLLNQPRTKSGNFWHKLIYPNQIWLDGLYMAQPFYMEYENRYHQNKNYRDIFTQFEQAYQLMKDDQTKLLYHGYDESRACDWSNQTTGLSKNFWTRSLGWYAMALVDTLEVMDEQFFHEYITLQAYLKEVLDGLLQYQDPDDKMFYQVTTEVKRAGNYMETSGSCAIAYALMKGARLSFLPPYYYEYGKEIFEGIVKNKFTKEHGVYTLKDICLVAGLGGMPGKGDYKNRDGTFEYYISEPIVTDDAKGTAPFLFAYSEIYAHQAGNHLQNEIKEQV